MPAKIARLAALAATLSAPSVAQQVAPPQEVDHSLVPYASSRDSVQLEDGRMLHVVCAGEGSPVVILTAGGGDWSATWNKVQPAIAARTRVCAWDRAGVGLSTPPEEIQTLTETFADMTAALQRGGIRGPYVLVGHSAGAYESLLLADRQPDQVAGMVLVDPAFPDEVERLGRVTPAQAAYMATLADPLGDFLRKCATGLRSGSLQPGGPDPDGCLHPQWPPSDPPELIAARERMQAEATPEAIADAMDTMLSGGSIPMLARNAKIAINPARNYGDIPLIILTRTEYVTPPDFPAAARAEIPADEAEWNRGHDDLAALSSRGVNIRVPGATHAIQQTQPQAVIDAISQVIDAARAQTS